MTRAVVFDIGGVLVDWQPHLAWSAELGSEEAAQDFLARTNFRALNARADGGEAFADLAREVADPEDRDRFVRYVDLYHLTVPLKIGGTWDLLHRLKDRGIAVHAITNWSAETWPVGLRVHPELGQVFGVTIVSGREGVMKPDRRIYELLCQRAGLSAEACLFIDDGAHNVEGARAAGMDALHFTGADRLARDLTERGLL